MAECLFCKKTTKKSTSYIIDVTSKSKLHFCNEFCYNCYGVDKVNQRVLYMHLCDLSGVTAMTRDMFTWYTGAIAKYDTSVLNDLIKTKKAFLKRKANEQKTKGNLYMLKTALGIALKMYAKHNESLRVTESTAESVDEVNIETIETTSCTYINNLKRRDISIFLKG